MYTTTDDVYATAGISATEVSTANITLMIKGAEATVDRITNTTYWNLENSGTASSGGNTTIVQSGAAWTADAYNNNYVWITGGTGSGQIRKISDSTTDTLTVSEAWTTNPDNTSTFEIYYTGRDPYIDEELRDADDTDTIFTNKYPLILLESASINSTTLTPTSIYQYTQQGKLKLSSTSEVSRWTSASSQLNILTYYYGVKIPYEVKRYVQVTTALMALMSQAGGTFNVPSTYSLPEGSLTIGQAYINIRGAWDMLNKEKVELEKLLIRYTSFA